MNFEFVENLIVYSTIILFYYQTKIKIPNQVKCIFWSIIIINYKLIYNLSLLKITN